eukprot:6417344-Amphidinium_carterae.1
MQPPDSVDLLLRRSTSHLLYFNVPPLCEDSQSTEASERTHRQTMMNWQLIQQQDQQPSLFPLPTTR